MPAKILGIVLILAALLLRRGIVKANQRGYVGSGARRIRRDAEPFRFRLSIGGQVVGALICFIAALLCFSGVLHHG